MYNIFWGTNEGVACDLGAQCKSACISIKHHNLT